MSKQSGNDRRFELCRRAYVSSCVRRSVWRSPACTSIPPLACRAALASWR